MNQPLTNRPIWDSEKDQPELCEKLREGFAEIVDPEIGLNIIQLGLIRNVRIEPDNAMIKMILTTPFCPYGPAMIETTRQKAEECIEPSCEYRFRHGNVGFFDDGRRPGCGLGLILTRTKKTNKKHGASILTGVAFFQVVIHLSRGYYPLKTIDTSLASRAASVAITIVIAAIASIALPPSSFFNTIKVARQGT